MAVFSYRNGTLELFGMSFGRKDANDAPLQTFAPPSNDDGATLVGDYSSYNINFHEEFKNEALLINRYREVSVNSEFERAINDIINEAISYDDEEEPIKLDLNKLELPESVRKKMHDEFEAIMQLLDFKHFGRRIFKRWYIDGRIYYHKIVDENNPDQGIVELRHIDPRKLKKVREELPNNEGNAIMIQGNRILERKYIEYFLYNEDGYFDASVTSGIKVSADSIAFAHSGLQDPNSNMIISYLHKALRHFNQLRMMEDSVVVAKFTRAPQRRAFYVDVGNLNRMKADQYMQETMRNHRNKISYDSRSGEFRTDKKTATMIEDYWFPKRGADRSTEIETLTGDNAFADMTDVDYFRKKMYESLNVPISRLESNAMFNLGRSSEITRDEVAFQHFINDLRSSFNVLLTDLLKTQVVLKNIMSLEDFEQFSYNIEYVYGRDNFYSELKNMEIVRERLSLVGQTGFPMEGLFSKAYIRKNIMQMTDEEIVQMDKEIADEKPETDELFGRNLDIGEGPIAKPINSVTQQKAPPKKASPKKDTSSV